jgi:hypothetical protein
MDILESILAIFVSIFSVILIFRTAQNLYTETVRDIRIYVDVLRGMHELFMAVGVSLSLVFQSMWQRIVWGLGQRRAKGGLSPVIPIQKAELFLRFVLKPADQEAILGDMEEIATKIAKAHGDQAAKRWYIWQVSRTIWSIGWSRLTKWGIFVVIGDAIRRIIP